MKITSFGQMANHTAKHLYRMNRAIVDALVSAGSIAAGKAALTLPAGGAVVLGL